MLVGIDEAGRGPLAGPVCAAAVILGLGSQAGTCPAQNDDAPLLRVCHFPIEILNDSKKLSAQKRDAAMTVIYQQALAWGIGWASAAEIDTLNILAASLLAMKRAFFDMTGRMKKRAGLRMKDAAELKNYGRALEIPAGLEAVIDGLFVPEIPIPSRAIVKADGKYPEVMAASILAKTARDRMMERYAWLYPEYGYEQHKGYPTREHRARLMKYGPSPIQRMSFMPYRIMR
jgi:ribonuclease HII